MREGSLLGPGRSLHGFDHSSPQFLERDAPDTGSQPDQIGTWWHLRRHLERNRPQSTAVPVAVDGGSQPSRGGVGEPPGPVARRRRLVVYCHRPRPGTAVRRPERRESSVAGHPGDHHLGTTRAGVLRRYSGPRPACRQAERRARPRRRRAFKIAWPARVDMRWRNPCFRARLRVLGWNVLFISSLSRRGRPLAATPTSETRTRRQRRHELTRRGYSPSRGESTA